MSFIKFFFLYFLCFVILKADDYKVIQSNSKFIVIEFDFSNKFAIKDTLINGTYFQFISSEKLSIRNIGEPWIPYEQVLLGIPHHSKPTIEILNVNSENIYNKFIIPYPNFNSDNNTFSFDKMDKMIYYSDKFFPNKIAEEVTSYQMRYAKVLSVFVNPFQFNPVTKQLIFNKKTTIKINYNESLILKNNLYPITDAATLDFIKSSVINYNVAKNWLYKEENFSAKTLVDSNWYNPSKDWFKIYLKKKSVYRLTFEYLVAAGVNLGSGVQSSKLEMYNEGKKIPIDIIDGGDGIFQSGDYLQFVGYQPTPTKNCAQNIYNFSNVYWFSYQAETNGLTFNKKECNLNTFSSTTQTTKRIDHYEIDSIYEPLGYANDDRRDYWFWGKASGQSGTITSYFGGAFNNVVSWNNNFPFITFRLNMHGMTLSSPECPINHKAEVFINTDKVGIHRWADQMETTYQTNFYLGPDSIHIYPGLNYLTVTADGKTVCNTTTAGSDEIRINWFELEYWSWNYADSNKYFFTSVPNTFGVIRYQVINWKMDNMKIYVPSKNEVLINPNFLGDPYKSVLFVDTTLTQTDFFCVSKDYFDLPDSIRKDTPSNLRNVSNGVDYIIITHSKFSSVANRLKNIRLNNFPDASIPNPRISVVDVMDIYDEFSFGLMDPFAIRSYVKYAFEKYQLPAPFYLVLVGDMSHDYRKVISSSRINYIPSIPFHSYVYGQAASDNGFVAVTGEDIGPDLAIGRISIETVDEGNIILDKLENYPADNSKKWKETFLLMSSGLTQMDEGFFQFNDAGMRLHREFVDKYGFRSKLIFRFINKPEYQQYQGSTKEIRQAFDSGAVFANYYGHGGGYQWDMTFLNDDIYLLKNSGRLPVISSVTCYTAHFDNQDVFGEQFLKVPNKGCIGFFGSSGLTNWDIGKSINELVFDELCGKKNYITGKAFMNAKLRTASFGQFGNQIALLTYLGDPVFKLALPPLVDFNINSNDISTTPENPVVDDSVIIKVNLHNYGLMKFDDSIKVELSFSSIDTSGIIGIKKIPVFGNENSINFYWKPKEKGLYQLTAKINMSDSIPELDYTDNIGSSSVVVFNVSDPSLVYPYDGFSTSNNKVEFLFADISNIIKLSLDYYIEIDTSQNFTNPISSGKVIPSNGIVKWISPSLNYNNYFWRTRIWDGQNFGKWSQTRTFSISTVASEGFSLTGNQLKLMSPNNVVFNEQNKTLALNTKLLQPKPYEKKILNEIVLPAQFPDTAGYSCLTTDGKYLYLAQIAFYAYTTSNPEGKSRIFKVGTGNPGSGTVRGQLYGTVPNFLDRITNTIFYHSDGKIYIPYGDAYKLIRVDPNLSVNNVDTVNVPSGMIRYEDSRVAAGSFYLTSDSQYVYNLAPVDTANRIRYTLKIFDPANNWNVVNQYYYPNLESYRIVSGFFVADGYFYPYDEFYLGYMRRIRIVDGIYDEEWVTHDDPWYSTIIRYYTWTYDWKNDNIYATNFKGAYQTDKRVVKFVGHYFNSKGSMVTQPIGPASVWKKLNYRIDNETVSAKKSVYFIGLNRSSKTWDTLVSGASSNYDLSFIEAKKYNYGKVYVSFSDTSLNSTNPIQLKDVNVNYVETPEIVISKDDISFSPDSLLQGFNITVQTKVRNISKVKADSVNTKLYLDKGDSSFYSFTSNIPADSFVITKKDINTSPLIFNHSVKALAAYPQTELYTFNNLIEKGFYVSRDSINPNYKITIDGKEIINGDIVSKKPLIKISLKDNSPLPMDTSLFTLIFDNVPLGFTKNNLQYNYSPHPNSEFEILWQPTLEQGKHYLDFLAKDPSGNFFDSIPHKTIFYVYDDNDLKQVFNYPNPFKDETYFTYEIRGTSEPDEIKIKIYTIAGRLIKDIKLSTDDYNVGFNKLFWDGKDQDGDEIANGLYFYKLIAKFPDKTKIETNKIVKMK